MKRVFIEFPAFSRLVKEKQFSDSQLLRLQLDILAGGGNAIQGTGGIKKIRCNAKGKGKSGGWRVLFADYDSLGLTFLIWAYPKSRQANLTDGQKKAIRQLKLQLDEEVER